MFDDFSTGRAGEPGRARRRDRHRLVRRSRRDEARRCRMRPSSSTRERSRVSRVRSPNRWRATRRTRPARSMCCSPRATRSVERVVYASSSSVYGNAKVQPVHEELPTRPISPYGVSKLVGERYLEAFHASYGLPTLSLRYFNVFGPRQNPAPEYAAVVPRFIAATLAGEPCDDLRRRRAGSRLHLRRRRRVGEPRCGRSARSAWGGASTSHTASGTRSTS